MGLELLGPGGTVASEGVLGGLRVVRGSLGRLRVVGGGSPAPSLLIEGAWGVVLGSRSWARR